MTILGYGSYGGPRDGRRNDCNCCVPHRRLHSLSAPGGRGSRGHVPPSDQGASRARGALRRQLAAEGPRWHLSTQKGPTGLGRTPYVLRRATLLSIRAPHRLFSVPCRPLRAPCRLLRAYWRPLRATCRPLRALTGLSGTSSSKGSTHACDDPLNQWLKAPTTAPARALTGGCEGLTPVPS